MDFTWIPHEYEESSWKKGDSAKYCRIDIISSDAQ